jgi:hypothetical protein
MQGAVQLLSRRDLAFLLYDWLDAESLLTRPRFAEHSAASCLAPAHSSTCSPPSTAPLSRWIRPGF